MTITFPNKTYSVKYDRLEAYCRIHVASYQGLETNGTQTLIHLIDDAPQSDQNLVYDYWSSLTEAGEATLTLDEQKAKVKSRILKYQNFGRDLIAEFSMENVFLGITIGQVEEVMLTAASVKLYLEAGSFPTALAEIDKIPRTAPFFTEERMTAFKQKITDYMAAQAGT